MTPSFSSILLQSGRLSTLFFIVRVHWPLIVTNVFDLCSLHCFFLMQHCFNSVSHFFITKGNFAFFSLGIAGSFGTLSCQFFASSCISLLCSLPMHSPMASIVLVNVSPWSPVPHLQTLSPSSARSPWSSFFTLQMSHLLDPLDPLCLVDCLVLRLLVSSSLLSSATFVVLVFCIACTPVILFFEQSDQLCCRCPLPWIFWCSMLDKTLSSVFIDRLLQ